MRWMPCVVRSWTGDRLSVVVGHPLVDEYLEFCRSRCRPNTIIAIAWDLKTFFAFADKPPVKVTSADVMGFIRAQMVGTSNVVTSMALVVFPLERSAGGCRRYRVSIRICWLVRTPRSHGTRSLEALRHGERNRARAKACR